MPSCRCSPLRVHSRSRAGFFGRAAGVWLIVLLVLVASKRATLAQRRERPQPTYSNVAYGPHPQNVLDFWSCGRSKPAPLVIYIHGGGFRAGSKNNFPVGVLRQLLAAGIHVASVEYRLVQHAPLPAAHQDVKRAVQFLRYKAVEWNIDKRRIGAFGGSAGAQLSMWLAFHDDMANPGSPDPIERESTRLMCVATN